MKRRLLVIDNRQRWYLETLDSERMEQDPRSDYALLSGEALCQYLLRRWPEALIIARGPLAFLSGNKTTVGYVSPITHLPHYSLVGGHAAAQLLNLGLDAICFHDAPAQDTDNQTQPILIVTGHAPDITVTALPADNLPSGQRSAFYWLQEQALDSRPGTGSILTLGEGATLGYAAANIAAEGIYHAGRGGAGLALVHYASALVLCGQPMTPREFWGLRDTPFTRNPHRAIAPLLDKYCTRLSEPTGGTITKLWTTGAAKDDHNTLPANNARQLGYALADLGAPRTLRATREGQTGCQWCQIDCRHWHSIDADYAPNGKDRLLDDFEPTYAIYAMLGLEPTEDSLEGRLALIESVEKAIILPIEQMGCDVIGIGTGLSALMEGLETGAIPGTDAPNWLSDPNTDRIERIGRAVALLRTATCKEYPALRAVGDGAQALANRYPAMADRVFTGGPRTLGNAGHANALWTFLMPFSRYYGHYVGQLYKIKGELPASEASKETAITMYREIVRQALEREFFLIIGNALSQCGFISIIYSQDGAGERQSDDNLLVSILAEYGIETSRAELEWFGQNFWAQSIELKCEHGWRPPEATEMPRRIYETLSLSLKRPTQHVQQQMAWLIAAWKIEAAAVMTKFGYEPDW